MMNQNMPFEIAVMGLGNLMRTDDAMGMLMLDTLKADARWPSEVRMIEGGTLGLDLLNSLRDVTHLLALDVVDVGSVPGTLVKFAGEQLSDLPISKSVHLLGFSDLLGVLHLMQAAPLEVVLLGVQPEYTGWGTELTEPVRKSQSELKEAVLAQVTSWLNLNTEQMTQTKLTSLVS